MIDKNFLNWLERQKGFKYQSAKDVLSRCRRVEKILNTKLDEEFRVSHQTHWAAPDLKQKIESELPPEVNKTFIVPQLMRAISLYAEFKDQNIWS